MRIKTLPPFGMDAASVTAYVNARWPEANCSPLAMLFDRLAVQLDPVATGDSSDYADAVAHAQDCVAACGGWDLDMLSHNIESSFPDLDLDTCDEIAAAVLLRGAQ